MTSMIQMSSSTKPTVKQLMRAAGKLEQLRRGLDGCEHFLDNARPDGHRVVMLAGWVLGPKP